MRYAIFSDVHANLEALESVLAKIDELAEEKPIDQLWFLGDLVGYGPNPNECISLVRSRTDVIIAGNHDWAAIGKLDLEDFSEAARISAEWTAQQLTEEHREFLANLPEQLEMGECTLVHGSPYGPLWEYLTSEILAERSFQYFSTRFCLVGHTHIPLIFQQPDTLATSPTLPLFELEQNALNDLLAIIDECEVEDNDEIDHEEEAEHDVGKSAESAYADPLTDQPSTQEEANILLEAKAIADNADVETATGDKNEIVNLAVQDDTGGEDEDAQSALDADTDTGLTPEAAIQEAEERLSNEIEELLELLGMSESMVTISNEMIHPPSGLWQPSSEHRSIINPGGVGQPRDGDPRASFMIYDTETGFEFYRVAYPLKKTQEKIIKAGLPHYLAVRLGYGR
jgi:diadenosine tetraphosphatase ApaH/serine/threonine PP2A family protein phosphatase